MSELYEPLLARADYDESKHRLGRLCKRGHDWMGTGQSLRWIKGSQCIECHKVNKSTPQAKARMQKWREDNADDQKQKARKRMAKLRQDPKYAETCRGRNRECMKKNRAANGRVRNGLLIPPNLLGHGLLSRDIQAFADAGWDLSAMFPATISESRKLWLHLKNTNPAPTVAQLVERQSQDIFNAEKAEFLEAGGTEEEWAKEYKRRYYHFKMATDTNYVLQMRERSRRRKVRIRAARRQALQPVTRAQIDARFAIWNNRCAFCGVDAKHPRNKGCDRLTIEHVLSLSKGGLDEASNILPSCLSCNLGKHNAPVGAWYRQQPFFTEARWAKIKKHCPAAVAGQLLLALL